MGNSDFHPAAGSGAMPYFTCSRRSGWGRAMQERLGRFNRRNAKRLVSRHAAELNHIGGKLMMQRVAMAEDSLTAERNAQKNDCHYAAHIISGWGPISALLQFNEIERVDIDQKRSIRVQSGSESFDTGIRFENVSSCNAALRRIERDPTSYPQIKIEEPVSRPIAPYIPANKSKLTITRYKGGSISGLVASEAGIYMLAFAWMALEASANIAFIGRKEEASRAIFLISDLLPSNQKNVVISKKEEWQDGYPHFAVCRERAKRCHKKLAKTLPADFDRLIIDGELHQDPNSIFIRAMHGIPFLINLGAVRCDKIVEKLHSHPFDLDRNLLNALDLVVEIGAGHRITGMYEFLWHEKSRDEGISPGSYRIMSVCHGRKITNDVIMSSMIMSNYAAAHAISRNAVERELLMRSSYLAANLQRKSKLGHSVEYFHYRLFGARSPFAPKSLK